MTDKNHIPEKILFFDGDCSFCQYSVQFVLNHGRAEDIYFAPLQGETFKSVNHLNSNALDLNELLAPNGSLVYFRYHKMYLRSSAAIWLAWDMGGLWKSVIVGFAIPQLLRNKIYNWIAIRRKKIMAFKKESSCLIPSQKQKARLKN